MSEQLHSLTRGRQVVEVGGRKVEVAALTLRDYVELRNQALAKYKRERIRTWTANVDLIDDAAERKRLVQEAFSTAQEMTHEDLPHRNMVLPKRDEAGRLIRENGRFVSEDQEVEYAMWWASETLDGRMFSAWLSMRACQGQENVTLDDVESLFTEAAAQLSEVTATIAELSAPRVTVPNSEGRRELTEKSRRLKKEMRHRRRQARRQTG